MSYERIRLILRIATILSWAGGVSAAVVTCSAPGVDVSLSHVLAVALLVTVITATYAGAEIIVAVGERIVERLPAADAVAARAIARGHVEALHRFEQASDVAQIGDYRR